MSDDIIYEITEDASVFWITNDEGKVTGMNIVPAGNRTLEWPTDVEMPAPFDWRDFTSLKEIPPTITFGAQLGRLGDYVFVDRAQLCWELTNGVVTYLSIVPNLDSLPLPLTTGTEAVLVKAAQRGWDFPALFQFPYRITWVAE